MSRHWSSGISRGCCFGNLGLYRSRPSDRPAPVRQRWTARRGSTGSFPRRRTIHPRASVSASPVSGRCAGAFPGFDRVAGVPMSGPFPAGGQRRVELAGVG